MARLIYILALLIFLPVNAQVTDPKVWATLPLQTGETLFIDTSDALLLAGETLHFKLYCLNPDDKSPSKISRIAYVELVGSDLKVIAKQKLSIENSVASGDFFLPVSLASGRYKIVGYTKRMLDSSLQNFFAADIDIVNPFQPFTGSEAVNPENASAPTNNSTSLSTDKSEYRNREKVTIKFNADGKLPSGNYSVSVRKKESLDRGKLHASEFHPLNQKNTTDALPELRGEIISGKITSDTKTVSGKNIALSIPGNTFEFKIVQTDKNGRFYFVLDSNPDRQNIVIQVMENDRKDYAIAIDPVKTPDLSGLQFGNFALDPRSKSEIEKRSVALQIENAYYNSKKESVTVLPERKPFFHPLEKTYVLDDFTRFPTLRETMIEVLKELYFTTDQGKYTIHVRNTAMDNQIYGPPLILVDGLLIQDIDELFAYGTKYVESVSLINEPYIYGAKTFSGLVNFKTKLEDYVARESGAHIKKMAFERPQREKAYFNPDYSKSGSSRIPDYRYRLLWADVSEQTQEFSFFTSDISGTFEIVLEGFTEDGKPVSESRIFEVK